ncbi:MAG: cell division protein FtsA [Candidatus Dojkabacteria bacterium]|nr:cell division protein FtsA [Candidatus Dojkabacteria bacterium]
MGNVVTAIDIGSHKVAVGIAIVDSDNKIKIVGESTYSSMGIKKGEITGIDDATNAIANALSIAERMAGLSVSSAYVSINGRQILSNNNKGVVAISDVEILEDDVRRALEQARTIAIPSSREIVHLIPRQFIVDQQSGIKVPVGMTGSRLEVDAHIVSAPLTYIHNIEKCIQSIGLKIDGFVFTGWASAQAVLTSTEKELGVVLLDIGAGTVSICTFEDDAITFSSSIPLGGSNVTRDLAAGLRLSLEDAERIKVNALELLNDSSKKKKNIHVKELKPKEPTNVENGDKEQQVNLKSKDEYENKITEQDIDFDSDIIDVTSLGIEGIKTISKKLFIEYTQARMEEIFKIVKDHIEEAGFQYKLPGGIVLTGGGSLLPGLTSLCKEIFGVPARVGYPKGVTGLVDGLMSPSYSVLIGSLLCAVNDGGQKIQGRVKSRSPFRKTNVSSEDSIIGKISSFVRKILPV